ALGSAALAAVFLGVWHFLTVKGSLSCADAKLSACLSCLDLKPSGVPFSDYDKTIYYHS
ncbi:MAG: hypothetical protein ACI8ZW_002048, partial [Yoonia sp.]